MKAAVIGVGSMGNNHARLLMQMGSVELVGIVDHDFQRAGQVADRHGTTAYKDISTMLRAAKPDAVVISVPTVAHFAAAGEVIRAGVHVLIEKPIASTLEEADQLIELADTHNVCLSVGHVERFNPAVVELRKRLDDGELGATFHIETRRRGPFPKHVLDVGVAVDLTVHDLDLIRFIAGSNIVEMQKIHARRIHTHHEDFVRAQIEMDNGVFASLAIDWLTPTKIRDLSVTGEKGMFRVDLLTQDLTFYENIEATTSSWDQMSALRGVNEGRVIKHVIQKSEPLAIELTSFFDSIKSGKPPLVTGDDGRAALAHAQSLAMPKAGTPV